MDAALFYVFNAAIFGGLILAATQRNELLKIALPFFVAIFGIFVMTQVNTDGGLFQLETACSSACALTNVAPVWPTLYLTLFGVLLNFAMTFYNGVKGR